MCSGHIKDDIHGANKHLKKDEVRNVLNMGSIEIDQVV